MNSEIVNETCDLLGRMGIRELSKLTRMLGYSDSQHFGQFAGGCYGDLIYFFTDNPGAIEAVVTWISNNMNSEWEENLKSYLEPEEEECDECDEDFDLPTEKETP